MQQSTMAALSEERRAYQRDMRDYLQRKQARAVRRMLKQRERNNKGAQS